MNNYTRTWKHYRQEEKIENRDTYGAALALYIVLFAALFWNVLDILPKVR